MKLPENCENMQDIRQAIDTIDKSIVKAIAQRAGYVQAAAKFKTSEAAVRDDHRVKKVIESKKALAQQEKVSPELIEKIYRTMIDHFIAEEMKEWKAND